jgi:1-acyl-sn-glycerol-3-phosphate acyltransferase
MMQAIARFILRIFGWQAELAVQMVARCVWVAKHTLFRWPLGIFMRSLGGIPLDRDTGGAGFALKAVESFHELDRFILAIAPEGTRHKTDYWKAGFYKIALKSGVPIALGFVDYKKKKIGIGKLFMPSGDRDKDFLLVKDFYSDKSGKYPEKQGEVRLR